jgi:4-hydroxythreonine-4-phosphate dehydrogenase
MATNLLLGITMGDPGGIGPEIILKAIYGKKWGANIKFVIIGSHNTFKEVAKIIKSPIPPQIEIKKKLPLNFKKLPEAAIWEAFNQTWKHPEQGRKVAKFNLEWSTGKKSVKAALCAAQCIKEATEGALNGIFQAIVTAPISKESFALAKIPYPGHTEYIADLCGRTKFGMMLIGGNLKVMLVTRHISLAKVALTISRKEICTAVELANKALKWFGVKNPVIGVCGLNPHCGDGGLLGNEEHTIIKPALQLLKKKGIAAEGPIAGDVAFYQAIQGKYQAVVAMYHDQGLAPLKTVAFDNGVNLTLGLPIIRTSPDHGTAFDIAGKNKAEPSSMISAIETAIQLAKRPNPFK